MARITLRQLLDHAAEHSYGVPAFNISNMEQGLAIMAAAKASNAPVILQASRGARAYAGDRVLARLIDGLTEMYPDIPVCMHLDHGNNLATCATAIQNGFTSVMMDGSLKADGKTPADYAYNRDITKAVVEMAHACGVECPKVAPLAAVEVVNPKMPCTVDADELRKMNAEGKITGCVVDGPLSMVIAIDPEAAHHKGAQDRPAAGHADILLFPDIQAGNLVYKTLVHTADCKNGCILTGTKVPAILTSRSDSFQTKVNSIALAAVVAAGLAE